MSAAALNTMNRILILIFCIVFFAPSPISSNNNLIKKWRRNLLMDIWVPPGLELPEAQWFEQTLDHFHPTDDRTWKQRCCSSIPFIQLFVYSILNYHIINIIRCGYYRKIEM